VVPSRECALLQSIHIEPALREQLRDVARMRFSQSVGRTPGAQTQNCENNPMQSRTGPRSQHPCCGGACVIGNADERRFASCAEPPSDQNIQWIIIDIVYKLVNPPEAGDELAKPERLLAWRQ